MADSFAQEGHRESKKGSALMVLTMFVFMVRFTDYIWFGTAKIRNSAEIAKLKWPPSLHGATIPRSK